MKQKKNGQGNYIRVLRTIWMNEGISRIEIADLLGLDKSTITNITASLQDKKIIIESAEGKSGPQGGRRPIKLKIEKNFFAAAGIEVQPDGCSVVCINLAGEILFSKRVNAKIDIYSFSAFFTRLINEIKSELNKKGTHLTGVGLGFSGIINPDNGLILESIPLGVKNEYAIHEELSGLVDVPVFIDNDANCCCRGELVFNRTEELSDFIYCLIEKREQNESEVNPRGLAVGMGVVIDGKVHYGRNFSAGEFTSVFADGKNSGQMAVFKNNRTDNKGEADSFEPFAVELGRNLALLINTFALSDCFIGGDLDSAEIEILDRALRRGLDRNWSYPGASACRIRTASIGEQAVAYGAASIIIDRLFRIPEHGGRESAVFKVLEGD